MDLKNFSFKCSKLVKNASYLKKSTHTVTHAGIEITLTRSPMATGFSFGRAENLENYSFFAQMVSEEFDPNLYLRKCLVCFWLKLSLILLWWLRKTICKQNLKLVWHEALARRAWQRDNKQNPVFVYYCTRTLGAVAVSTLYNWWSVCCFNNEKRDWKTCWIFLVPVFTRA